MYAGVFSEIEGFESLFGNEPSEWKGNIDKYIDELDSGEEAISGTGVTKDMMRWGLVLLFPLYLKLNSTNTLIIQLNKRHSEVMDNIELYSKGHSRYLLNYNIHKKQIALIRKAKGFLEQYAKGDFRLNGNKGFLDQGIMRDWEELGLPLNLTAGRDAQSTISVGSSIGLMVRVYLMLAGTSSIITLMAPAAVTRIVEGTNRSLDDGGWNASKLKNAYEEVQELLIGHEELVGKLKSGKNAIKKVYRDLPREERKMAQRTARFVNYMYKGYVNNLVHAGRGFASLDKSTHTPVI